MAGSGQLFNQAEELRRGIQQQINRRGQQRGQQRGRLETRFDVGGRRAGIEGIRRRASDIERRVEALPQQLQGRTAGRLVTQGQLDRLTSSEQNPLIDALRGTTRQLSTEQQGLADVQNLIAQRIAEGEDLFRLGLQQRQTDLQSLLQRAQAERALEAQRAASARAAALQQSLLNQQMSALQPTPTTTDRTTRPQFSDFGEFVRSRTRTLEPTAASEIAQIAKQRNPNLSQAALNQIQQIALANQRLQQQQSGNPLFAGSNPLERALNQSINPSGGQIGGIGGFIRGLFG